MDKKGFTLVELMVVIVIIGVLAAVAIPKMMAATNKAKASEGPQMIGSIANLEHAFGAEYGAYANAGAQTSAKPVVGGWGAIGMDQNPISKYFTFTVSGSANAVVAASIPAFPTTFGGSAVNALGDFTVRAGLINRLGEASANEAVAVDDQDNKKVSTEKLGALIGSFGATVAAGI